MPNLPEPIRPSSVERYTRPVRHPSVLRAAVWPSAIVLTAAGVVVGAVLLHSVIVAIVLGAGAWAARMLMAIVAQSRRERAAQPRPAVLDPYSVPDPWRQLVIQALNCQDRFDRSVADWAPGPIRERLTSIQPRLWGDVENVGSIARRGAALSGWTSGAPSAGRPSAQKLAEELREAEAERRRLGGSSPERDAALARTEAAIAAQIRALRRASESEAEVLDRLRLIVARLDETVTSLLVLGAGGGEADADTLTSSLDEIQEEITSLSNGLAEASGTSTGALPPATPPSAPPTP